MPNIIMFSTNDKLMKNEKRQRKNRRLIACVYVCILYYIVAADTSHRNNIGMRDGVRTRVMTRTAV